ncbi:MAG: LysR substrate-binding domain-containing protein [Alphaproteobacteria bacterium]
MESWLPSLNALRAFESVTRHLSYPAAAEELRVTPAAVKQLVRKLEDTLGQSLVVRKGRGLELTRSGLAGRDDLRVAMDHLTASVARMQQRSKEKRLIISVEASFATAWLVPKLEEFRRMYPDVAVLIDSSQHIVDLHNSGVDVAIRYGGKPDASLVSIRLFDDRVFPACSPLLAEGPPKLKQLSDLAAVPLIHWDMSQMTWAKETKKWFSWENWLRQFGAGEISSDDGVHFSDYGLAVQAAIAGQGVVLASVPILRDAFDAGLLVNPFPESLSTDIGYDLVTTELAQSRAEVAAFIVWIETIAHQQ